MEKLNVKGFPLLHKDECKEMFSADSSFSGYYFIRPIYKWLPDFDNLDDEEKAEYEFKDLKEGMYLIGLEVISEHWVNEGFCAMLLHNYGLVLDDAFPMNKIRDKVDKQSFIYLTFDHIAFTRFEISVSS